MLQGATRGLCGNKGETGYNGGKVGQLVGRCLHSKKTKGQWLGICIVAPVTTGRKFSKFNCCFKKELVDGKSVVKICQFRFIVYFSDILKMWNSKMINEFIAKANVLFS